MLEKSKKWRKKCELYFDMYNQKCESYLFSQFQGKQLTIKETLRAIVKMPS
jgi:hypothetical protein